MEIARRSTKTGDELTLETETDDVTKKMGEMSVDAGNNSSFVVVESWRGHVTEVLGGVMWR